MMEQRAVIAIGGNSMITDNARLSVADQAVALRVVAKVVAAMRASGMAVVVTHGNGPQVELGLRRAEIACQQEGLPLTPLANCVADTQGGIGYLLQQAINNCVKSGDGVRAITVITQVEVDADDPGFQHPTKPIGIFYSAEQRQALGLMHPDWQFMDDAGRGFRRVVASPEPRHIVEAPAIKLLASQGYLVIGAGGGGIPVIRDANGDHRSIDAVIDKDLSTALLAREINADLLVITTGVEAVCIDFGKPRQRALGQVSAREMALYMAQGHFPVGSMLPKIAASLAFLDQGGKRVIITSPACLMAALAGETGTHILP